MINSAITYCLTVFMLLQAEPSIDIWQITGKYLKLINELPQESLIYPVNKNKQTIYSFIINDQEGDLISDPNYLIEPSEKLLFFTFKTLAPHSVKHILIILNGKWEIIYMAQPQSNIFHRAIEVSEHLNMSCQQKEILLQKLKSLIKLNQSRINRNSIKLLQQDEIKLKWDSLQD